MIERAPIETINLDQYGNPLVSRSQARDRLADSQTGRDVAFFLGTSGPDGRPRAARVGALWHKGDFYFVSGPETRKSRNLATNPACTIAAQLEGIDLVFEGEATRVVDRPTLEKLASLYREHGWPAEVEGSAFIAPYNAPSAGPPPWFLYRITTDAAVGVTTAEPYGATRWRFAR